MAMAAGGGGGDSSSQEEEQEEEEEEEEDDGRPEGHPEWDWVMYRKEKGFGQAGRAGTSRSQHHGSLGELRFVDAINNSRIRYDDDGDYYYYYHAMQTPGNARTGDIMAYKVRCGENRTRQLEDQWYNSYELQGSQVQIKALLVECKRVGKDMDTWVPKQHKFTFGTKAQVHSLAKYSGVPVIKILLNGRACAGSKLWRIGRDKDRCWMSDGTKLADGIAGAPGLRGPDVAKEVKPVHCVYINTEQSADSTKRLVDNGVILAGGLAGIPVGDLVEDLLTRLDNDEFPGALCTMDQATADLGESSMKERCALQLYKGAFCRDATVKEGKEGGRVDLYTTRHGQGSVKKMQLRALNDNHLSTGHGNRLKRQFHETDIDEWAAHKMEWDGVPAAPDARVVGADFYIVTTEAIKNADTPNTGGLISTDESWVDGKSYPRRPYLRLAPSVNIHSVQHKHMRLELQDGKWYEVREQEGNGKKRPRMERVGDAIRIDPANLAALGGGD